MAQKSRVLLSWSSGKDSAWTLNVLRQNFDWEVVGLLTTVNSASDRVAMHDVRRELLEAQALATGLPLQIVPIPWPCSNAQYEAAMEKAFTEAQNRWNISSVAFGDLFLEDIRVYREEILARNSGLKPLFPLWGIPTDQLAHEMIASGLRANLTCVDSRRLPPSFAGREFDQAFLTDLPSSVDPCGESGEFHTFVHDGPMFLSPIPVVVGEVVERGGFYCADLMLQTPDDKEKS